MSKEQKALIESVEETRTGFILFIVTCRRYMAIDIRGGAARHQFGNLRFNNGVDWSRV